MSHSPSTLKVVGLVLLATLLGGLLFAQDEEKSASPSDLPVEAVEENAPVDSTEVPPVAPVEDVVELPTPDDAVPTDKLDAEVAAVSNMSATKANWKRVIASLTIFVLAVFVGFEVITKVPPTLHTPLMSGSNAISGITLVGAVIVAGSISFSGFVGFIAVALATVNAVGGFMVTHRMLAMFKKR